jgi:hypothetical protein
VFCNSFVFFLLVIILNVLKFTSSDYLFSIFKSLLQNGIKERWIVTMTNGTYPWWCVTQIFRTGHVADRETFEVMTYKNIRNSCFRSFIVSSKPLSKEPYIWTTNSEISRQLRDVFSILNTFGDYVGRTCHTDLEIKSTTDTTASVSYYDMHLESENTHFML